MLPLDPKTRALNALIEHVADYLQSNSITRLLEAANLQPTTDAAYLAANAAVSVLYAHDLGQSVTMLEKSMGTVPAPKELAAPPPVSRTASVSSPANGGKPKSRRSLTGASMAHRQTAHRPAFKCPNCKRPFTSEKRLSNHVRDTHGIAVVVS